ncbi:MAG: Holliday junction resolvase RuvX [Candidatus Woesebacteria bacterium]|nr:MAG: Holliday junction resolvase RuvX [Candidatus Woesebacteria bacterium]
MKVLGIDYGRAKVGLAIGVGSFAEPYDVIRYTDTNSLIEKIGEIVKVEKVEKIVIGLSENEIGEATKKFAEALHSSLSPLPFEFFDETLTSQDAQKLSREAGMSRKKARGMEDAFAASIMLQNYLDSN